MAVAALIAAGVYAGCTTSSFAQSTNNAQKSTTGTSTSKSSTSKPMKSKSGAASTTKSGESMAAVDDATFLKKAYEGGLAEIALGRLAQEKASSDKVKKYAQEMVDEHTMANQMLAAVVSGNMGNNQTATGSDATNNGSAAGGMGAGSGTAMGSGTGTVDSASTTTQPADNTSTGNNNSTGNPGTAVGSGSTGTSGATGAGTTGTGATGTGTGSDVNSGVGAAGTGAAAGSTGTGSTMGSSSTTGTNTGSGVPADNNTIGATADPMNGMVMASADIKAREREILSTELSAEHKALQARLSKLSGAEFDRQYMMAMVKDHDKMLKMVSAKADEAKGSDNLTAAQAWAKEHLPVIRNHKEKATKIAESKK